MKNNPITTTTTTITELRVGEAEETRARKRYLLKLELGISNQLPTTEIV